MNRGTASLVIGAEDSEALDFLVLALSALDSGVEGLRTFFEFKVEELAPALVEVTDIRERAEFPSASLCKWESGILSSVVME